MRTGIGAAVLAATLAAALASGCTRDRKLIEMGWDEPDPAFLRKHLAQVEATPFDGCVFHLTYAKEGGKPGDFIWECWGKRAFTEAELKASADDLAATKFRRFHSNFLRFNVVPGNVDWFDDFSAVLSNAELAARIAKRGNCAGILFDVESYQTKLFDYPAQRDTLRHGWYGYSVQARRRGAEVMDAFERGYPGVTVFLTFGYSMTWWASSRGARPFTTTPYGLLAPFLDGMLSAADQDTRIVDGMEIVYGARERADFAEARQMMENRIGSIVGNQSAYAQHYSLAFPIWLDHEWRHNGWSADSLERNYLTPSKFQDVLHAALDYTDKYVWIYSETPRWWSESGSSVKLPESYVRVTRQARGKR